MYRIEDHVLICLGNDGGFEAWSIIPSLAERAWTATDAERPFAWHHLVMAVGNFKRDARIRLQLDIELPVDHVDRGQQPFVLPDGEHIEASDPDTWQTLIDLKGLGIATTSAILAALWPTHHAVIDRRSRNAFVALQLLQEGKSPILEAHGIDPDKKGDRTALGDPTLPQYEQYRRALADEVGGRAAIRLMDVERALYSLEQRVSRLPETGRSWREYSHEFGQVIADAAIEYAE